MSPCMIAFAGAIATGAGVVGNRDPRAGSDAGCLELRGMPGLRGDLIDRLRSPRLIAVVPLATSRVIAIAVRAHARARSRTMTRLAGSRDQRSHAMASTITCVAKLIQRVQPALSGAHDAHHAHASTPNDYSLFRHHVSHG